MVVKEYPNRTAAIAVKDGNKTTETFLLQKVSDGLI